MAKLASWDNLPEVISVKETADIMRVSSDLIYRLAKKNAIPHVRLGGSIRIPRDIFRKWVESTDQLCRPDELEGEAKRAWEKLTR